MDNKRELKFRAWRPPAAKFAGEMVYDIVRHKIIHHELSGRNGDVMDLADYIEYNDVMQFTGLVDRNGVDIYEVDILEIVVWSEETNVPKPEAWTRGEVLFRSGAFRAYAYLACEVCRFCEVRCNIYENPDRLDNGLWPEVFTGHPDRLDK